jgi:hypothetical protein
MSPTKTTRPRKARTPRCVGSTATSRPGRVERTVQQFATLVREEQPTLSDARVFAEAKQRVLDQVSGGHPLFEKELKKLTPSSVAPGRKDVFSLVEEAAVRRTPYVRAVRAALTRKRPGRPSDRSLAVSVYERMVFGNTPPEIDRLRKDFITNHPLLDWAYDEPATSNCGHATSSVNATMKKALTDTDPELLVRQNIEAMKALSAKHPGIGANLAVDGTDLLAHCEQRYARSLYEEELLSRHLGATYVLHAKGASGKAWRGWTLLVIIDLATTLPLVWTLRPANRPEAEALRELLDLLFRLWPDICPETLSSDKAYGFHGHAEMLERDYGIHPVIPLRADKNRPNVKWEDTRGVPTCPAHGEMKLYQAEGFLDSAQRLAEGLPPGQPMPKWRGARLRWECEVCPNLRVYTRPSDDARYYTYLPRHSRHRRSAKRLALQHRHNAAESVMGSLKRRGMGQRGVDTPKWVQNDRQMEWYAGGTCLAMTLRRVVHEEGLYALAATEATNEGLLEPASGKQLPSRNVTRGQHGLRRGATVDRKTARASLAGLLNSMEAPPNPGRPKPDRYGRAATQAVRAVSEALTDDDSDDTDTA